MSRGHDVSRRPPAEGDRVMIHGRPITREDEEGFATVVRVVRLVGTWEGVDYFLCRVMIDGETEGAFRTIAAVVP